MYENRRFIPQEALHAKSSQIEFQSKVLTQNLQQAEEKLTQRFQQAEEKLTHRLQQAEEKLTQRLQQEEKLTQRLQQEEKLTQALQQANEKLTQHLEQVEEKVTKRIQQHEEKVSGLNKQVELLKRQLENVTYMPSESKSSDLKDVMDKFKLHGRHEMLTPNRRQSRSADPDEVAFTADLSHELTNVPIHTTLIFDDLYSWTDDSYDASTGVFTCPTSGLYLFAVFIEPHLTDVESMVSLKMDGKSYMFVISEIRYDGEDDVGGN
ncbi:serum response factor homolog A-like, partial [Mercenaria mercenaria]|uniref:serum response factor homolog A-like n=1 Tax=Mercenaria mercenaria TaxID=6596 RepID=UPI00234E928B